MAHFLTFKFLAMKTNKIILGIAAVVFAAGAAFASVSSAPQTVWYKQVETNPNSNCVQITLDIDCTEEPNAACHEMTPHGNRQLFSNNTCTDELYRQQGL